MESYGTNRIDSEKAPPPLVAQSARNKRPNYGWEIFVPCTPKFWKIHLGTDMLQASWWFVLASVCWLLMGVYMVQNENTKTFRENFYHACQITSATLFTIGSLFMVFMAHNMESGEFVKSAPDKDWSQVNWIERYVTGNHMLLATWFFAISTLPFLPLGLYIIFESPSDYMGYTYVVGVVFLFAVLGLWVIGSMNENIAVDGGLGSTHFYDKILLPLFRVGALNDTGRKEQIGSMREKTSFEMTLDVYFKRDLINGMWIFFFISIAVFPYGIYYVIVEPDAAISYYSLVMCFAFAIGAGQMVYTSFPENYGSTVTFDFFTCYTCQACTDSSTITHDHETESLIDEQPLLASVV